MESSENRLALDNFSVEAENNLKEKFNRLKSYIEMTPRISTNSFVLKTVNNEPIRLRGLIKNEKLTMDQLNLGPDSETLWSIQNQAIRFVVYVGRVDLKFRVNDKVHVTALSKTHSLQLKAGIPFKLETFEIACEILLISAKEDTVNV